MALLKQLLFLAIPIFIGGAVQTGYHLINTFWVGRLGANALAVVSLCFPINLLLISLGSGISLAGSILIAQHFGAHNQQQVNHVAAQTLTAVAVSALLFSVCGYFAAPYILRAMGVDEVLFAEALGYMRISFASMFFLFLSSMYQAILRGIGEAKAPLRIIMASVVVNSLLDPLLIFGWGPVPALGVNGAAYATGVTQAMTAYAGIRLLLSPRFGLQLTLADLRPDWPIITKLFRVGLPASIEQTMQALYISIMTVLAAQFGTTALAAYGIVLRIITFTVMPTFSISMAASILTGQNIGAGNKQHAHHIAIVTAAFSFCLMLAIGVVFYLSAVPVIQIFVPADSRLIEHAALVLCIYAATFAFSGIQLAMAGVFRGAGDTFTTMLLTLFATWVVQLPLAVLMSRHTSLGEMGLWWSSPIAAVINTAIALTYFKSGRWLRAQIARSSGN
jgi:putative MATE family efflux protein